MSGRIASQHLAAAYDDQVRSIYHAMMSARREGRAESAAYCRDYLHALLSVRRHARDVFVSAPNPSTIAFRQEQAAHGAYRDDRDREYMSDQISGLKQAGLMR